VAAATSPPGVTAAPCHPPSDMSDDDVVRCLRNEIQQTFNFDPENHVREAIKSVCDMKLFHPVKDYFDGVKSKYVGVLKSAMPSAKRS
jgi:hypothetical protein